jgi:hypothetical protein
MNYCALVCSLFAFCGIALVCHRVMFGEPSFGCSLSSNTQPTVTQRLLPFNSKTISVTGDGKLLKVIIISHGQGLLV